MEKKDQREYRTEIFYSHEDEAYIAVVLDFPRCSSWGETCEEAARQIGDAIEGHLTMLEKYGDPVPDPTSPFVS